MADNTTLKPEEYIDWGSDEKFQTAIGVGECAGVIIDLVATLFFEAEEKLAWSAEAFATGQYGDSIYYSYASFIHSAKGLLLDKQVHVNTHHTLINDFDKHYIEAGLLKLDGTFKDKVLQINKNEPTKEFAELYFEQASKFYTDIKLLREKSLIEN